MPFKLQQQLKELGSKLDNAPTTKDSLAKLLKQAAVCLSELDQSPPKPVLESMHPFLTAIVKPELLKHQDKEVRLLVATCVCEITRITAPEAPYSDDVLKDIFHLIVSTFSGLSDTGGPSFGRRVVILETLARYRSCVMILDLECYDLVNEIFRTFLTVASNDHPESVLTSMQTIMVVILEESEDIWEDLLLILLSVLGRNKKDIALAARRLAMNVIEHSAEKLEPVIKQFLISLISGDSRSLKCQIDCHEVIYDIYRCAPQILIGVVPYLTGELLSDQLDVRLKAVGLVGDLFSLPESANSGTFQPLFLEFLKRLTDRVVDVRMSVLEHVKICLLSNPSRVETPQIISSLCDRLFDYDESIRKQVVAVISDVACHALNIIPVETINLVAERLRDKSLTVKKYTLERLAEIYKNCCLKQSEGSIKGDEYDWIPGKILRCFYDKDFRSDSVETILCTCLFPSDFTVKDKVRNWIRVFSGFDKVEIKALEKILEQKQRLQQEMQKYLSFRQMYQEGDAPELQKKVMFCFRIMSRCFVDAGKAEENFLILDQLKDANIWKILTTLLDPNTSSVQASNARDDLLGILGEKHPLFEFLRVLSLKCSYLLFNKEHAKEIFLLADAQKSAGNTQVAVSYLNMLVILAHFSPLLLSGIAKELVHLLEDENESIKEGILHILAKAGGTIREQLGVSSSSLDLILERICLEGSRRQAKYAVHALAAITKDDGLMALSVLYKRLVDMLNEKTHLPAVLQSLGCIAQTAMPVFETREKEIEGFIRQNILKCTHKEGGKAKENWDERSELCSLKIYGIKTLVKSYLPVKDAHLRTGIDELIEILKNVLYFGEISKDIESSEVDKAQLKLAAAKAFLRLSKHWDHKIPIDVFYQTLTIAEASFPQVRKIFLNKVQQYIKDRLLEPKFVCAFLINIDPQQPHFEEEKQNVSDIIQMCQQGKVRQLSMQCDASSPGVYPEYILPYLVHAIAHHPICPDVEECRDIKAYEPIYRQLYSFISMLVHGDGDGKSDDDINKEKESILTLVTILQSIKSSEDNIDTTKSKNLYAVCDLGLSILKRLTQKQDDAHGSIAYMSLPSVLYKPREKKEGDNLPVSEEQTWLADEGVVCHFESLKLEANGTIHLEIAEDEVMRDSETDASEVPLGKMIKRLKAKGAKTRKEVKNDPSLAGAENKNDVDILRMVREINSHNEHISGKVEARNGGGLSPGKFKTEQKLSKRKSSISGAKHVPVPKRQRSSSAQGAEKLSGLKCMSKGSMRPSTDGTEIEENLHMGIEDSFPSDENKPSESDLLVSSFQKNSSNFGKHKGKKSSKNHSNTHEEEESNENDIKLMDAESPNAISNTKSGSTKNRKQGSIMGLAKCTSKGAEVDTMDLIGCRIKVWWPMDKKFYEGEVKAYDSQKKKHVVLYDDGDVEVLRLAKERWELIDNGRRPAKRLKSSKSSPLEGVLSGQRKKSSGGSKENRKSIKLSPTSKVTGKRTPRKNLKYGHEGALKSKSSTDNCEPRRSLDIPFSEPSSKSKIDEIKSEDEEMERRAKNSTDAEESDNDEKSISDRNQMDDGENSPSNAEHTEQEPDYEGKQRENVASSLRDDQESDDQKLSQSEGEQKPDVSREEESTGRDDKVEKLDLQTDKTDDASTRLTDSEKSNKRTSGSSHSGNAEISDDEPLGMWKRRVVKPVKGR